MYLSYPILAFRKNDFSLQSSANLHCGNLNAYRLNAFTSPKSILYINSYSSLV